VKQLLGLSVLGLAIALMIGAVGCQPPKTSSSSGGGGGGGSGTSSSGDGKKSSTGEGTPKDEVKFKESAGKVDLAKMKDSKEVKIELTGKAAEKITLTITAKDKEKKEAKGITGAGEIAKGDTSGMLKLSTGDTEVAPGTYWVEVHGKGAKGHASIEVTVK
jgi:hypothetical protein